jgi:ubiquinol-cytochrome c reductase cytochrome b subunit
MRWTFSSSRAADAVRAATGVLMALYLGVVLLSGVGLAFVWSPEHATGSTTVAGLVGVTGLPSLLRSAHAFSAEGLLVAAALHFVAILFGAEPPSSRSAAWRWGVICALVAIAATFTGRILPFDEHGGVSLDMAGAFLGLAPRPRPALGASGASLGAALLLHVALGIGVALALVAHARPRPEPGPTPAREDLGLGRAGAAIVAAGVIGLLLAVAALRPTIGPAFVGLDVTSDVSAAWYLRWLQALSERGVALARLAAVAALALGLSTPRLCARLGWPLVRVVLVAAVLVVAGITAKTYV